MAGSEQDENTETIKNLNDEFRQGFLTQQYQDASKYRSVVTAGIAALDPVDQFDIATMVRDFNNFNEDNDPHGEHDFGSLTHQSNTVFWKIDYYAPNLNYGSEDPADSNKTCRVLTIMLSHEY